MKNSLIIILLVSMLTSCHKGEDTKAKRRIINETSHSVNIEVFGGDERFEYELEAFDTLEIEGSCSCCVTEICDIGWWSDLAFANIIFNDTLQLSYAGLPSSCQQKSINADPLGGCYGYTLTRENGWSVYTYLIDEEDYESAEPIGGN